LLPPFLSYNRAMITSQLSSDILEEQFGPTAVNILHQDNTIRIIQTFVIKTGQVLELSLVRFLPEGVAAFSAVHQSVLSGDSMGKAFRAAGVEFRRETEFACHHNVPSALQRCFDSQEPATVSNVRILVGPDKVPYATIVESYTPITKWPHLFGDITPQAKTDLNLLAEHL